MKREDVRVVTNTNCINPHYVKIRRKKGLFDQGIVRSVKKNIKKNKKKREREERRRKRLNDVSSQTQTPVK